MTSYWTDKNVLITGGAALIGSHLADYLLLKGVKSLTIADNLYSGKIENIPPEARFINCDLREYSHAQYATKGKDVVFHLACRHGGRGYIGGGHDLDLYDNLTLDTKVFRACADNKVSRVVFMSSACAYPIQLQGDITQSLYLTENLIDYNNIRQADGPYGLAKLLGEQSLRAFVDAGSFSAGIARGFTVYGPRMKENHAIAALIAKAFIRQDPFEIWGDGTQKRNWTYVTDTVRGLALIAEKGDNGKAYNIGIDNVYTPDDAVSIIFELLGWQPKNIKYNYSAPIGPVNRIADNKRARVELGWYPRVSFFDGLEKTVKWYLETHKVEDIKASLEKRLVNA